MTCHLLIKTMMISFKMTMDQLQALESGMMVLAQSIKVAREEATSPL